MGKALHDFAICEMLVVVVGSTSREEGQMRGRWLRGVARVAPSTGTPSGQLLAFIGNRGSRVHVMDLGNR